MPSTRTHQRRRVLFKTKEPSMYCVILHNDDYTTMDFVVHILTSIFRKDEQEAEDLMMKVHVEGSAVAGTYTKDIAESKRDKATKEARMNGFPLVLTVEEDKR